jgi:hypothetical protein
MLLAIGPTLAAAQSTVYESKDKAGPVFSDQPSTGAKQIELGPARIRPPQRSGRPPPSRRNTSRSRSLAENGPIHSTPARDVSVRLQPTLQSARGDRIIARLDGRPLKRRFNSVKFGVTEADWQSAANPDNVEHTLQAVVVDKGGAVLIESAPVKFYAHRAVRAQRR